MEIRNYITTDFKAIDSQETIATVKDFFDLTFHTSVVEEGIYIVSSEDIENFDDDKSS
jgi:hypothetical protein